MPWVVGRGLIFRAGPCQRDMIVDVRIGHQGMRVVRCRLYPVPSGQQRQDCYRCDRKNGRQPSGSSSCFVTANRGRHRFRPTRHLIRLRNTKTNGGGSGRPVWSGGQSAHLSYANRLEWPKRMVRGPLHPGVARGCSHGWSGRKAAQPVVQDGLSIGSPRRGEGSLDYTAGRGRWALFALSSSTPFGAVRRRGASHGLRSARPFSGGFAPPVATRRDPFGIETPRCSALSSPPSPVGAIDKRMLVSAGQAQVAMPILALPHRQGLEDLVGGTPLSGHATLWTMGCRTSPVNTSSACGSKGARRDRA